MTTARRFPRGGLPFEWKKIRALASPFGARLLINYWINFKGILHARFIKRATNVKVNKLRPKSERREKTGSTSKVQVNKQAEFFVIVRPVQIHVAKCRHLPGAVNESMKKVNHRLS